MLFSPSRGQQRGAILQKPSLIGSGEATIHVLSEGEQTAAGLAGFLTEVHFDESKSAVILMIRCHHWTMGEGVMQQNAS